MMMMMMIVPIKLVNCLIILVVGIVTPLVVVNVIVLSVLLVSNDDANESMTSVSSSRSLVAIP